MANLFLRAAAAAAMFAVPIHAQSSRDSAGVVIVENARPSWSDSERLSLADRPRLVIGSNVDSAYRFRQVRAVVMLADGRIAVADASSPSQPLRLFTAEGRFLSVSVGQGSGPGQMTSMRGVQRLRGDTIAIQPGRPGDAALYSITGEYLRTASFAPSTTVQLGGRPPVLISLLNSGLAVAAELPGAPEPRPTGSRWAESLPLKLVTESSDVSRDLGSFPFVTLEQVSSGPTSVWLSSIGVFAAGNDRFYYGFGDRYEIRVFASDGKLQSIIRRAWTPTPITDDDWEHWVVEWSKLWVQTTGAEREREIQRVREAPWAEENPAFSQFIVDRVGRLWVRDAHWEDAIAAGSLTDPPAVPSSWSVFDPGGRWLGDVSMPVGFQAFEIGADYVAGSMRGDGVNQVVIYGLRAGG